MTSSLPSKISFQSFSSSLSHFLQEAQCGKLGFTIVSVNMVAIAILGANLIFAGAFIGGLNLLAGAIILPSIALFGPTNYLYYLPQPLRIGIGFVLSWILMKVNPQGVYHGKFARFTHFDDDRLAKGVALFCHNKKLNTVIDYSFETRFYEQKLKEYGIQKVQKYEEENTDQFDCMISLDAAEYLVEKQEEEFANQCIKLVKEDGWILLTYQGAEKPCQDQKNLITNMAEKGWVHQQKESEELRYQTSPYNPWLRYTLYAFQHQK